LTAISEGVNVLITIHLTQKQFIVQIKHIGTSNMSHCMTHPEHTLDTYI